MEKRDAQRIDLNDLGYREFFAAAAARLSPGEPARVVRDGRDLWHIVCERGEFVAALSGKFRHMATSRASRPAVGDWVMAETAGTEDRARIHHLLPRQTAITRKVPGDRVETQVVAANVDLALIVCALDGGRNFNVPRLHRYLALVRESGSAAALVLNKSDLCEDPDRFAAEARALAPDLPVHVTCALTGRGVDGIRASLKRGMTCALLGPSGVGKSALVNQLLGDAWKETGEVRTGDRRGRHTTSYRELLPLPGGALVIDTPGLREIQLWGDGERLAEVFPEIEALAPNCRFTDCRHLQEPGCAVQAAVADGRLSGRRLATYHQLRAELDALSERQQRHHQRMEHRRRQALQREMDAKDATRKGTWS